MKTLPELALPRKQKYVFETPNLKKLKIGQHLVHRGTREVIEVVSFYLPITHRDTTWVAYSRQGECFMLDARNIDDYRLLVNHQHVTWFLDGNGKYNLKMKAIQKKREIISSKITNTINAKLKSFLEV